MRLGLCCKFSNEPIRFFTTTARYVSGLSFRERDAKLSGLCLDNVKALRGAIEFCYHNGIGSFRVNSKILPLKTHPDFGYDVNGLSSGEKIKRGFGECGQLAKKHDIRLTFHPDQFIVLSSPDTDVVRRSVEELDYQAQVSEWIGADVINIHGGGAYGDKPSALKRFASVLAALPQRVRQRLTLENDDRVYTPSDLLPFCEQNGIPFVYDVHHHRCLSDNLSVEEVTQRALKTWDREPLFHISSPKGGWNGPHPNFHHDYINPKDFPDCWRNLDITVEIEAKAKEKAIQKLRKDMF